MTLIERAAAQEKKVFEFLVSPAAMMLPASARDSLRFMAALISDLAREVETLKGGSE